MAKITKTIFHNRVEYHNKISQYPNIEEHFDKQGRFHRDDDKPAKIGWEGDQYWYRHGKLHRDGGKPAVIWPDGRKCWLVNGEFIKSNIEGWINND